jgi:signal transduction histidine kinase
MTFELSPPVLSRSGLSSVLRDEGEKICREHGLVFVFAGEEIPSMPDDERILIFRCAQELMRNCVRHAKAHRMELSLWNEGSRMVPQLVNDEIGFDVASLDNTKTCRSFRFFSVRERVLAIEGALVIDRIDEGTCIDLIAPID